MSNGAGNPFTLLSNAQFGLLLNQAAAPVITQSASLQQATLAMANNEVSAGTLNTQLLAFQAAYAGLAPYFTELAARAAAGN